MSSVISTGPPQKKTRITASGFKLPMFSTDIERCISKDSFYTSPQKIKIIRESCTALYGYCREKERPVTSGDPNDPNEPEVIYMYMYMCIAINPFTGNGAFWHHARLN